MRRAPQAGQRVWVRHPIPLQYHQPLQPPHPYVGDPWRAGDLPPPPQYRAAPREAPQDPPTAPDWPDSSDQAWSRKQWHSRPPPAWHTRPWRPHSPHRHRASTTHSRRSRSPRRRHDPPGPRSRSSRSHGRHHPRHLRPMSTSPSPHEPHRASRSPLRPYPTPNPSPRHHRSCSPRRRQARHRRPVSTSPSPNGPHQAPRSPRRQYPSSDPSPRYHRFRSPRRRHARHQCRSASPPRCFRTSSSDPPPQAPAHLVWWSAPALQELRRWVKWAGGAGRREGVHMVHTFEEVRTRSPADASEATLEAIMPQAAWEALLRDAVQGLRPTYTPQALRQWLQDTQPQTWAIGAHPQPTTTTPGRGRARTRGGQGTERDTQARGHGRAPAEGQAPIGTGHRKRHNVGAGAGTEAQRKRTPRQAPESTPRTGIPRQRDQRRPTPSGRRTTPRGAHPQHAPPKQESDAVRNTPAETHQRPETTQGMEGTPTGGERATPTELAAGNTAAQPTTTPSPPGDDPGHHKGHLTGTRGGQRHGHSTQG